MLKNILPRTMSFTNTAQTCRDYWLYDAVSNVELLLSQRLWMIGSTWLIGGWISPHCVLTYISRNTGV